MVHNNKGISLIEGVAIVVVIALLAFLGYFAVITSQKKARDQERVQTVHKIYQSLLAYLLAEDKMPENAKGGDLLCSDDERFLQELLNAGYLDDLPQDEKFEYCYYDYGPDNQYGAVIGIPLEGTETKSVCEVSQQHDWCDENYYCLCQPYRLEQR